MKQKSLYRRLLVYLRPYWWPHFACAIACMVLFSATNGAMPFLIRHSAYHTMDHAWEMEDKDLTVKAAAPRPAPQRR